MSLFTVLCQNEAGDRRKFYYDNVNRRLSDKPLEEMEFRI